MNYPYSDEFLTYDYKTHRYVLTEQDIFDNFSINLDERIKNKNTVKTLLRQVSLQIYTYIHSFNLSTSYQDYIIAKTARGREIIKEAMEQQLLYWLTVGDLTRSVERDKRELWIDEMAKETLLQTIPELGTTICYTGSFRFKSCDESEW